MTLRPDDNPDDETKQSEPEAVEGGFGTGLRAQLRKRLHPELVEEIPPEPVQEPEPEFVSYDFEQPAAVELNGEQLGGRGSPVTARGCPEARGRAPRCIRRAGGGVRAEVERGVRGRARADEARRAQRAALRHGIPDPGARAAPRTGAPGAPRRAQAALSAPGRGRSSPVCCRRAPGGAPGTRRRADGGRATRGSELLRACPAFDRARDARGEARQGAAGAFGA